ncbi:MAG: cation transporter [Dehalococcoidia bacterium]|nr:cation transporter [Dehalococcoidia bacterium]MCB9508198.1 cation transporter [Myxococcales bacterium]
MKIQLLYFEGCPNLERARAALRDAMAAEQIDQVVEEVDVESATTPESLRGWGSPTILIDGRDLTGAARTTGAACRLYAHGAPTVDEIRAHLAAAPRSSAGSSGRAALSMLGAITAAIAASACCLVPAVLAVVGLSGAGFGAALAPYRLYFLAATGVALGVGFWLTYRRQKDACGCSVPRGRRATRVALWFTAAVVVALAAYPLLGDGKASAGATEAPAKATLQLQVSGMDCADCTTTIAKRLQKVPGVVSATVDFDSGLAVVRHDGRDGMLDAAIAAVRAAGYSAKAAP